MRVKKRKLKLIPIITIFVVGIITFSLCFATSSTEVALKNSKKLATKVVKKDPVKSPKDYKATLFMVGDALIHYTVYNDAKQADGSYDFKPQLQYIKPIASKYDLAYYNQETILGGAKFGYSSYPMFNSPQEVGDAFIDAGFDLVSLATNHTMDKREAGVLESVAYWKRHPEIVTSGQWDSYESRAESVSKIYEVNKIKYAFLSYTIWNNGLPTPAGKDYLNNEYSDEKAAADIAQVRDKADFVIVAMHWGTEYYFGVDYRQEAIANYLSSLGVDLIIGAHPHVVETAEYINDGKTFVIYSLGNFISDQADIDNFTGLAFEVTLNKHVDSDDKVTNTVINPKAQLIYTTTTLRGGVTHDFRVMPFPQLDNNKLPNYLTYYEKYKKIVSERYPDLEWKLTYE